MDLQRGILDLASRENCVTTIQYWDADNPLNTEALRDCAGVLLFNAPLLSAGQLDALFALHIPVVLVDHALPGQPVCSVSIDNEGGMMQAGLAVRAWLPPPRLRRAAGEATCTGMSGSAARPICAGWRKRGCSPSGSISPRIRKPRSFAESSRKRPMRPTRFFSSDYLAFSLLPLLAERRQGRGAGPLGSSASTTSAGASPRLYAFSSIDIRPRRAGCEALRLLLRLIQEDGCPCCHVRIGTQLVVRGGKPLR